ncbi:unnamed protein product [Arabis nemorensis]|uniref:Uncharacterized protein n=1 Tax=Arabis nemorensis TaxID=586526 RepID=A0A565BD50_9BRAS|nr:unnamed protein product [Arabis nemorensis]
MITEHEGDIFVYTYLNYNPKLFKLNLKRNVWEEMRELGGLTIFGGPFYSLTRAGPSAKEKTIIYTPHRSGIVYFTNRFAWVDPPCNNVMGYLSRDT